MSESKKDELSLDVLLQLDNEIFPMDSGYCTRSHLSPLKTKGLEKNFSGSLGFQVEHKGIKIHWVKPFSSVPKIRKKA